MSALGGGGVPCTICAKTVYPAETISFEKKPYHVDCFTCSECEKKKDPASMTAFEDKLYCKHCFGKLGLAQQQRNVKWTPKEKVEGAGSAIASKFGGGGSKCVVCNKTAYNAEAISFDKKIYHAECLKCHTCDKKTAAANVAAFEGNTYCRLCFQKGGFAQKQRNVQWEKKEPSANAVASRFGGGGTKCHVCAKTVYAAETVSFDKRPFHAECFKCTTCQLKIAPSGSAMYEEKIYCHKCFKEGGFSQKQAATKAPRSTAAANPKFSKFGGGGIKCKICTKTVYPAETLMFEKDAYHIKCFACVTCSKVLTASAAEYTKGADHKVENIYCKKCYMEAGLNRA